MSEINLGNIEDVIGFDDYIEKILAEKQKIIDEQQATIKKQDIEIRSLNLHIEKLVDGDEISQLLMREYERSDELEKENEKLKERLYDFEKRKIIEESEIDEDVIPKVKLLRTELFGEKYE